MVFTTVTPERVTQLVGRLDDLVAQFDSQLAALAPVRVQQGSGVWSEFSPAASFGWNVSAAVGSAILDVEASREQVRTLAENLRLTLSSVLATDESVQESFAAIQARLDAPPTTTVLECTANDLLGTYDAPTAEAPGSAAEAPEVVRVPEADTDGGEG